MRKERPLVFEIIEKAENHADRSRSLAIANVWGGLSCDYKLIRKLPILVIDHGSDLSGYSRCKDVQELLFPLNGGGKLVLGQSLYKDSSFTNRQLVVSLKTHNTRGEMVATPMLLIRSRISEIQRLTGLLELLSGKLYPSIVRREDYSLLSNFKPDRDINWSAIEEGNIDPSVLEAVRKDFNILKN